MLRFLLFFRFIIIYVSVTSEITPLPLIYNLIATFRVLRSFDQVLDWSFSVQIYVYDFSFIKYLAIYIFRSGKAFQRIYYSVDEKYLVAKLLHRQNFSPVYSTNWSHFAALLCIDNVGIINKPFNLVI